MHLESQPWGGGAGVPWPAETHCVVSSHTTSPRSCELQAREREEGGLQRNDSQGYPPVSTYTRVHTHSLTRAHSLTRTHTQKGSMNMTST